MVFVARRPQAAALLAVGLVQVTTLAAAGCTSDGEGAGPGRASPSVTSKIQVGQGALSVAVTPDGRLAYTANQFDVSVIDLADNAVVATLPWSLTSGPKKINFSSDGRQAYVAGGTIACSVSLIDTAGWTEKATISVEGGPCFDLAVSGDGQRAYVANRGGGLAVVDVRGGVVASRIPLPDEERGSVGISPDGRHVYVAGSSTTNLPGAPSAISVVDTATNRVSATIPLEAGRVGDLAVTADGHLYAAHFPPQLAEANVVSVIDTGSNAVRTTIPVKGRSTGLAPTSDGTRLYVVNESGLVQVIDTNTGQVAETVQVGTSASDIAIAPDRRHAYVTNYAGHLTVIDIS